MHKQEQSPHNLEDQNLLMLTSDQKMTKTLRVVQLPYTKQEKSQREATLLPTRFSGYLLTKFVLETKSPNLLMMEQDQMM